MKIGLKFPESLTGTFDVVRQELDHMVANIKGGWYRQHNADGQHTEITATKIGHPLNTPYDVLVVNSGLRLEIGPLFLGPVTTLANRAAVQPPQLTANQNDYEPLGFGRALVVRLTADVARSITGLKSAGEPHMRLVILVNAGTPTITLVHNSGSSSGSNRFRLPGGANLALTQNSAVLLLYFTPDSAWYAVSGGI